MHTDPGNVEINKRLWEAYAQDWAPEREWVVAMAADNDNHDNDNHDNDNNGEVAVLGDEWSSRVHLAAVIDEYISPYISPHSVCGDLGCGGGRVARRVLADVRLLHCFDISTSMLKHCRAALADCPNGDNASFHLVSGGSIAEKFHGCFDFVVAFDLLVHMDLHTMFLTLENIRALLKKDGRAFVSTANVMTSLGWERFSAQKKGSVGGFCWVSPEIVLKLVEEAGLKVVKRSDEEAGGACKGGNMYTERDFLIVVERA